MRDFLFTVNFSVPAPGHATTTGVDGTRIEANKDCV